MKINIQNKKKFYVVDFIYIHNISISTIIKIRTFIPHIFEYLNIWKFSYI